MKVIDPGHHYELLSLDGKINQQLIFVKREGSKFPGNVGSHPGTTLQSVFRALLERMHYLQAQVPCVENEAIISNIIHSLLLLEKRAARRHGISQWFITMDGAVSDPMCPTCGHVVCNCPV